MGRTSTPTYRVEFNAASYMTHEAWDYKNYGKPSDEGIKTFVEKLEASTMPGGVNEHLDCMNISGAKVVRQSTGETVAQYQTAAFQVI